MTTSPLTWTHDARFDADVNAAPTVLVAFSGHWCPPCRLLEPTLAALAKDRADVKVLELDADENQATAQRYQVRALPTLFLFRGGRVVGQRVGNQSRRQLDAWLDEAARR